jgi:hypothetical protein
METDLRFPEISFSDSTTTKYPIDISAKKYDIKPLNAMPSYEGFTGTARLFH